MNRADPIRTDPGVSPEDKAVVERAPTSCKSSYRESYPRSIGANPPIPNDWPLPGTFCRHALVLQIKGGPTMFRTRVRLVFAGLAIALGSASGCASDGSGLGSSHSRRAGTTNVVQRPTYEVEGTKPLYLGGY